MIAKLEGHKVLNNKTRTKHRKIYLKPNMLLHSHVAYQIKVDEQ